MSEISGFPRAETLKSGLAVTIRPLRSDDRERIASAVRNLDRESIYFRLFSYRNELTERGLDRIMTVDSPHELVLVVTTGEGADERVIGSGRYVVSGATESEATAEVAFMVDRSYQGQGIAGRLLLHLAAIARDRHITAFEADVLSDNKAMLGVFSRSGLSMRKRREGDTMHITLPLRDDPG